MTFKFLTIVFNSASDEDSKKETVKEALAKIEGVLLLDEYSNGFKYIVNSSSQADIVHELKDDFIASRLRVEGKEDELFMVLTRNTKVNIDPSASSFRELDQNRMKNLF